MAKIGFLRADPQTPAKEEHSLDAIDKLIKTEIYQLGAYESQIRIQLQSLEDLKNNFLHTEKIIESIEKLHQKREEIVTSIRFLKNKRPSEIDVDKIRSLFDMLNKLDNQISPMLQRANQELQKLIVEETHLLYAANRETKAIMDIINDEARKLQVTLKNIESNFYGRHAELTQINQEITALKQEKIIQQANQPQNKAGF